MKLGDSELKVMDVLWREGETTAKRIAAALHEETGWNVNTAYTLVKRCVEKGAIERREPGFLCRALVSREDIRREQTKALVDRLFDGREELLFASLLGVRRVGKKTMKRLRKLIEEEEA